MTDHPHCTRAAFVAGALAATLLGKSASAATHAGANVAPDDALARLMRGNHAYVNEMAGSRLNTIEERAALGNGQAPWASILTCADSRTAPEILFNQGLGDIFVCRVAGNGARTRSRPRASSTAVPSWVPSLSWSWATPAAVR